MSRAAFERSISTRAGARPAHDAPSLGTRCSITFAPISARPSVVCDRRPASLRVSVITLGLGIGASTAIFSAVDGVLLKSLPYRDAGQPRADVGVEHASELQQLSGHAVQSRRVARRRHARSRASRRREVGARSSRPEAVSPNGSRERRSRRTTSSCSASSAHIGRTFVAADSLPSAERPVILAYGFWVASLRRRFRAHRQADHARRRAVHGHRRPVA